jgi:hypothetical protein
MKYLANDGTLIYDNTDVPWWPDILSAMGRLGFKEISFTGLAAQTISQCRTTVFYRPNNNLGI